MECAITICVALKNRTRVVIKEGAVLYLFANCIESIDRVAEEIGIRVFLSIADFGSEDIDFALEILKCCANLDWEISKMDGFYSSGAGLNRAVTNAPTERVFLLDADMILSSVVLQRAIEVVDRGGAYFPVCWSYKDAWHAEGWWRWEGFGNAAVHKSDFVRVEGVPEFNRWGREDNHFFERIAAASISIVREKGFRFFHQWHPNERGWKERYYDLRMPDNRTSTSILADPA